MKSIIFTPATVARDRSLAVWLGLACLLAQFVHGATPEDVVQTSLNEPDADRWMYSFNGTPGARTTASTFSALPQSQAESGVDDRSAQFLIRFNTAAAGIPAGLGPANYRIHELEITGVITQGGFRYDPTPDPVASYGGGAIPDPDVGRPIELHGTGFRGGFDAATFQEGSPYGFGPPGSRNAFALGYDAAGAARDVSNNVTGGFDPVPWATASFPGRQPGDEIPGHATAVFRVDLSLPGVAGYLAEGLHRGYFWLTLSSLHSATQMGSGGFPAFHTRDHPEQAVFGDVAPRLSLAWSLPLTIRHFSRNPVGETVRLEWDASPGFIYQVESSSDLAAAEWTVHGPIRTDSPAVLTWTGPSAGPRGFFRITRTPSP